MLGDEVLGFSGDTMGGSSEVGHRSKGTEDDKESVADRVVEAGLAVSATEEVVTIRVKWLVAVVAGRAGESWRQDGKAKLALEGESKDGVGEAVVGNLAMVGGEGKASEWIEERREGNRCVRRGRGNGLDHGEGSMVLVEFGREEMKGCGSNKLSRGGRRLFFNGSKGRKEGGKEVAIEFETVEGRGLP